MENWTSLTSSNPILIASRRWRKWLHKLGGECYSCFEAARGIILYYMFCYFFCHFPHAFFLLPFFIRASEFHFRACTTTFFISMLFYFYSLSLPVSIIHILSSIFFSSLIFLYFFLSFFSRSQQDSYCAFNIDVYILKPYRWLSISSKKDNSLTDIGTIIEDQADWFSRKKKKSITENRKKNTHTMITRPMLWCITLISMRVLCMNIN